MIEELIFSPDQTNIALALQMMSSMDDKELMDTFSRCYSYWRDELSFGGIKAPHIHNHHRLRKNIWVDLLGVTHLDLHIILSSVHWIEIAENHESSIEISFVSLEGLFPSLMSYNSTENFQGISDFFRKFIENEVQ